MSRHKQLRGADLHAPSSELVENNTGSTLAVLKGVKFNGLGTLYPQIVLANSSTDIIRGLTQTSIASGATGYITSLGIMTQVNTNAWPVNTLLYCDQSGNVTNAPNNLPVASVLKQDAVNGVLYVISTGIIKADLDNLTFPDALSLELAWDITHPSFYTEPTYDVNGRITATDVWESSSKALHLFNKAFVYTGAQLTKVTVTRVYDSKKIEKTIAYDSGGRILNITRVYTP